MPDYKKMYFHLFNTMTDILTALEENNIDTAKQLIQQAQCDTEELYIMDA